MIGATFAIYSEQEGGTPLWTEDQNVELDANGNYTALLGATKNGGVPPELFAGGEARWLQVKFYAPGEVDLPRVLLVSVPYALKAGDADTLGGKPASAYLLAGSSTSAQPSEAAQRPAQPETAVSAKTAAAVNAGLHEHRNNQLHLQVHRHIRRRGQLRDVPERQQYRRWDDRGGHIDGCPPHRYSPYAQLGVAQTVDYMTFRQPRYPQRQRRHPYRGTVP
jgi:hypothetical protein